jgi:flagellar motor switch protein FliM
LNREPSQQGVDALDQGTGDVQELGQQSDVSTFDFGQLDRIPKSQLRAIHLVHENFVRNVASSLSAFLRSYVVLNLISLERVSYAEFLEGLSSPTCIAYIGLTPYEGTAILEMNISLMFTFLELLLGSKGRGPSTVTRNITDIEKKLLHTLMRVIMRDLSEAWKTVAEIAFSVQSLASEPQLLLHVLAPAEAVIVISIEVRIGSTSGSLKLAIPSIFIKRLRNKFEHLLHGRKAESTGEGQEQLATLLQDTCLTFEARMPAGQITARTLLELNAGDVLMIDQPLESRIEGQFNEIPKWLGDIVIRRDKLVFRALEPKLSGSA